MNPRVKRLREQTLNTRPYISAERAELLTAFYQENEGKHPPPILRALSFKQLCEHKTIYIGTQELIVGERGPAPMAVPTYPELTCHSTQDLEVLRTREKTSYEVSSDVMLAYKDVVIPYWRGRSLRDRIFEALPLAWKEAYAGGMFTEFMEQRAPGHTAADGKIYQKGLIDLKAEIAAQQKKLRLKEDIDAVHRREQLEAMSIAADATMIFARRHAELAKALSLRETDSSRKEELSKISETCARVPGLPPRDFWEALQMYWFCHLAVITELNGWDSFCPGHLDQHLKPFYDRGIADGTLTRQSAKELLECFFIKFNNHPAPPKVGVTAAESGTYTDFANINLGGQGRDGGDGVSEVSFLLLEVIDEMHLLQPSQNVQISEKTPDAFLLEACRVIREGYGFPSVFNADMIVEELVRQGKTLEDAREGGASGCVEAGAFGKEAYILTGYFNLPKVLELTLTGGWDPITRKQLGLATFSPLEMKSFDELFCAWKKQLRHFVDLKLLGNDIIERMYAQNMPAPFLSLITDDCIEKGLDYNEGGARYNTSYLQGVGIGTLTDALTAIKTLVFDNKDIDMSELLTALERDYQGFEPLQNKLKNKVAKWGNDDDRADELMKAAFDAFLSAVEGRANQNGGRYHINMLPTTCHVYFGGLTSATPDGRSCGAPLSEGISPVQGMDRNGPTAVILSAAKMEHRKTGGTLLNLKFLPGALLGDKGLESLAALIRTYFKLGGHHIQFNVVSKDTLRQAQVDPDSHRNLIVRVAGYSDYFCNLSKVLQDEIISRTEQRTV
ncbi:MAG: glycyl radical protein [Myxococcota bacterium]|jgi:formate C-acetyltransferase|nr:glycyl radical protein [Myxococcota bacterium]